MANYRYSLEPYKGKQTRFVCPNCKKRTLAKYIDSETNSRVEDGNFGRCNNENSCGYWKKIDSNNIRNIESDESIPTKEIKPVELSFLSPDQIIGSLNAWKESNLIEFLLSFGFTDLDVGKVCLLYKIGCTKLRETVFYYVDVKHRIRTGQIIPYKKDGHRDKEKFISSVPSRLKLGSDKHFSQCIFGEHILNSLVGNEPIGFVESPKTAIICSLFRYKGVRVWLSYTSQTNLSRRLLTDEVLKLIGKRKVYISHDFHFSDRMIFGTIEPRKARIKNDAGKTVTKWSRNGTRINEFESKSDLLDRLGLNYKILDSPLGEFDDTKNDIADYLLLLKPYRKTFSKCSECQRNILTHFLSNDSRICPSCLDRQLKGVDEKSAMMDYYKSVTPPVFSEIVDKFSLEIQSVSDSHSVIMPFLPNLDYSEERKVSYEDLLLWYDKHIGEPVSEQDFNDSVLCFLHMNKDKLTYKHIKEEKYFLIKSK